MSDKEDDITSNNQKNLDSNDSLDVMQKGCLAGIGFFCGALYFICIVVPSRNLLALFLLLL
jgi:uncharacterized protein YuzB (UPF0349 family)